MHNITKKKKRENKKPHFNVSEISKRQCNRGNELLSIELMMEM